MRYPIAIETGDAEHAYGVVVPDLPGCFSAGDTLDEALVNSREAILLHVEGLLDDGQPDFRFHDLRHTWASWHVQSGTSLPELMELGGWKSYEMVLRYAHLAPEKLSFVAGRIERQASKPIEEAPFVKNVAKNATFSLCLLYTS